MPGIGVGVGLSAVCGGAAAFDPTTLSGYVDSPYSIAALRGLGKLWQDAGKTVAATADGDPVRVVVCGSTDYTAPSDAARPLLWSEGGGKWSLSFDGVDDTLHYSATVPVNVTLAYGFLVQNYSYFPMLFSDGSPKRELRLYGSNGNLEIITSNGVQNITNGSAVSVGVWYRGIAACSGGGTGSTELYQNGAQVAQNASDTTSTTGTVYTIGSRGSGFCWPGRMTGVVFLSRKATVGEVADLDTYLAALAP